MQGAKNNFDNFAGYDKLLGGMIDKLLGGMIGDASPPQKLLGGMHPPHPPRDLRPWFDQPVNFQCSSSGCYLLVSLIDCLLTEVGYHLSILDNMTLSF